MHLDNVASYGEQDLSLTLSRLNRPKATMTVTQARKMLLDLLQQNVCTFIDGRFKIAEEIKVQAQERASAKAQHRLEKWERLINEYQGRSEWDMINAVNAFFNEKFLTQFEDGMSETKQEIDSFRLYPKFATALMHSQELLALSARDAGHADALAACNCE